MSKIWARMHTLISHLVREWVYEIIFVLMMVRRKEQYVKDISGYMLLDMVIENWSGKRKDREEEHMFTRCSLEE